MNREQMIEKGREALTQYWGFGESDDDLVGVVLDAVLPQVLTVAELEALPVGAVLLDRRDKPWTKTRKPKGEGAGKVGWRSHVSPYYESSEYIETRGPVTVVWTPEVTS